MGGGECYLLHGVPFRESSPPIKLEIVDVEKVRGLSNYYVRNTHTHTHRESA